MTSPSGILDFFVLEASEYIEQLDGLVLAGGGGGPNAEAFQRAARALRGSATMARLSAFADLAAALERAARALREGALRWSPALSGAIVGAVDDLKILVRAARAWGEGESRRATARAAEISGFLPAERAAPTPHPGAGTGPAYVAGETANIAAGVELLLTGPADSGASSNVLQRLRALRGIAAIRDVPPLPEVLEAADDALRPLDVGGRLAPANRDLLEAAAAMLRDVARSLRAAPAAGGPAGPVGVAAELRERFDAALARFSDAERETARVVPVAQLFFDDAGPHVVTETPNPPTTPAGRFRLEMVGHGEHLRRLLTDARAAGDDIAAERARRAIGRALAAVRATAESFGEATIAATAAAFSESLVALDGPGLSVLTGLAELLSSPGHDSERLRAELPRLLAGRAERARAASEAQPLPDSAGGELTWLEPPPAEPAPSARAAEYRYREAARAAPPLQQPTLAAAPPPAEPRPGYAMPLPGPTPSAPPQHPSPAGAGLASLLDLGIASVEELVERPLTQPVAVEETVVPIESLIYRGEAALQRARELRDDLRGQDAPPREALEELYDLLDLVTE